VLEDAAWPADELEDAAWPADELPDDAAGRLSRCASVELTLELAEAALLDFADPVSTPAGPLSASR
jgi:hypothetical protein